MRETLKWIVISGLFLLLFIPLLRTPSLFFLYITGKNFAFRIIVEIISAAWILLALYDKKYRPRLSWVAVTLLVFVAIIFIADLFGASPAKSFWSNFERMEGFVTLAHLLLYFFVAGSMLTTEKMWNWFFNTSLVAAFFVSYYAFKQLMGWTPIAQGGLRIDATLGNAIYMAVYMFFHVFIALFLLVKNKYPWMRVLYGVLTLIFMFLLWQTGTRGTILGLGGGVLVSLTYIAIFFRGNHWGRSLAVAGVLCVLLATGGFYAARNSSAVKENPILSRVASIFSLKEALGTRLTIWSMALEGVKERPVLGWGQSNFDYVFDAHYRPSLYAQEPWFDRVHDIVLDWLVAGGVLGFAAYAGIWVMVLYALVVKGGRGLVAREVSEQTSEDFSVVERAILIGLLVGYGIHNIVVFDNLISYFFFVTILAFVHMRVSKDMPRVSAYRMEEQLINQIALPVVGVALCLCLYFVNVPSIRAAGDIIDAILSVDAAGKRQGLKPDAYNAELMGGLDAFKQALDRHSFGDQEIREQIALTAQKIYTDKRATAKTKSAYTELAESELRKQIEERPDSARTHAFLGTFYRTIDQPDKALEQFEIVKKLSPNKQSILFDLGFTYIDKKEYEKAKEVFKQAFDLAPEYDDARAYYIVGALYTGDDALVTELSAPPHDALYREHNLILQTYYELKKYDTVLWLLEDRIQKNPGDVQLRISKSAVQHESGDTKAAIQTITQAIKDFPDFKTQGEQIRTELLKTL